MLRFLTAGESHGKGLLMIIEGIPAGLPLSEDYIAVDLRQAIPNECRCAVEPLAAARVGEADSARGRGHGGGHVQRRR